MSSRRPWHPQRLAGDVDRELARLGGNPRLSELAGVWPEAVGPGICANAWPARYARDGTLIVHTRSSTWASELTQLAEEIRGRLVSRLPDPGFQRLRFVVGPLPEPSSPEQAAVEADPLQVSPETAAQGELLAAVIDSQSLRSAVARAIAASIARSLPRR